MPIKRMIENKDSAAQKDTTREEKRRRNKFEDGI